MAASPSPTWRPTAGTSAGPVYSLTDDNNAVIVGLVEGTWRSAPQIESWQAVMAQVYIDSHTYSPQQQPPALRMIGRHTALLGRRNIHADNAEQRC